MFGQPTAASLQQSGSEHEELSDLQSRWLDLRLSAGSLSIDFGVWNVIPLRICAICANSRAVIKHSPIYALSAHVAKAGLEPGTEVLFWSLSLICRMAWSYSQQRVMTS